MMPPPDVGTEHRDRQRDGQPENVSLCGGIKVVSGTTNFATLYYVQLLYVFWFILFCIFTVMLVALRIHVSKLTYMALSDIGSYKMTPRGEIYIKVRSVHFLS